MVELVDGTVLAQLGVTDMRMPIQYALSYPERWPAAIPGMDFTRPLHLDFEPPDRAKFPCLALAYRALEKGGTAPAALNAANEEAVAAFLDGRTPFTGIPETIEAVLDVRAAVAGRLARGRARCRPARAGAGPAGPRAPAAGARALLDSRPEPE